VHAVNFRRELVLENPTCGSMQVLEFQHQKTVGTLTTAFQQIWQKRHDEMLEISVADTSVYK